MDPEPPRARIEVAINDSQSHMAIDPEALRALARRVLEGEGVDAADVSIVLVDDPTIREINRRHLGHDWPTDVITFRLSDPGERLLEAELVVSAEMAATTAREVGADPGAELALYVVHGLLHLCGFDDARPDDAAAMRTREAEVLRRAGLANTYPLVGARPGAKGEGATCTG